VQAIKACGGVAPLSPDHDFRWTWVVITPAALPPRKEIPYLVE